MRIICSIKEGFQLINQLPNRNTSFLHPVACADMHSKKTLPIFSQIDHGAGKSATTLFYSPPSDSLKLASIVNAKMTIFTIQVRKKGCKLYVKGLQFCKISGSCLNKRRTIFQVQPTSRNVFSSLCKFP